MSESFGSDKLNKYTQLISRYGRRIVHLHNANYVNSPPQFFDRYKFMVSNVNLVKYHAFSDSDILPNTLVKYYSFGGADVCLYVHVCIRPYEGPFKHQLVYSSIITP